MGSRSAPIGSPPKSNFLRSYQDISPGSGWGPTSVPKHTEWYSPLHESLGGPKDASRRGPGDDRQGGSCMRREVPVVGMAVREHQGEQASIAVVQAGDRRQQRRRVGVASVQRQAEIEQDALALGRQFDAGASDLLCSAMDANAESVALGAVLNAEHR